MKKIAISALVTVTLLSAAGAARADCCNDFWSCAAAVATGGLSCQVQAIVDTVNSMKTLVETMTNTLRTQTSTLITQARSAVGDAAGDLQHLREQAIADLQKFSDQAHAIAAPPLLARPTTLARASALAVGAPPPGAAPLGTPPVPAERGAVIGARLPPRAVDPQALAAALNRADQRIRDLRARANTPSSQIASAEQAALAAAARHAVTAAQIGLDIAITPLLSLRDELLHLLEHPESIFDPSAQINADIQSITAEVPAMLDRITNEVSQEATADLQQVEGLAHQLTDSVTAADAIVQAMGRAADSKLQPDLDALERLVPPSPTSPGTSLVSEPLASVALASGATIALPSSVVAKNHEMFRSAVGRADPKRVPIVVQQRVAVSDLSSKWQSLQILRASARVEPATSQRADREIAAMYAGKSRADVDKKKNDLLEEAKRRYAHDPKTLQKVQQYIEAHTPKG